jgi:hypothetical protein
MAINDFLELMPHTVSHAELASRDAYGKPVYGSAVDYTARVLYKNQKVRAKDGSEVVARGVVWIGGTPTVSPDDQLTLPDGSTPIILSFEQYADEDGAHHTKIFFG